MPKAAPNKTGQQTLSLLDVIIMSALLLAVIGAAITYGGPFFRALYEAWSAIATGTT